MRDAKGRFRSIRVEGREKIGWKAVLGAGIDGKYYSYVQSSLEGGCEYKVGQWIQPKKGCGPLCVFRIRQDATFFAGSVCLIKKCLYVESEESAVWYKYSLFYPVRYSRLLCTLPPGTVLASAVKLL